MDKKSFKIGLLIGICIALIFTVFVSTKMSKRTDLENIAIEKIEIASLKNEKIILKKDKPIIINFWATWCAPCVKEMPEFEKINQKYKDKIQLIAISDQDNKELINFKKSKLLTFEIGKNIKGIEYYGIKSLPTTYIYDSQGKLVKKINVAITYEELDKILEPLIK